MPIFVSCFVSNQSFCQSVRRLKRNIPLLNATAAIIFKTNKQVGAKHFKCEAETFSLLWLQLSFCLRKTAFSEIGYSDDG